MRREPKFFAILIVAFAAYVSSAQEKQQKEYQVSARDKAELQRLAKRFVARMQQTRDVEPLIPEFFMKDHDVLLGEQYVFLADREGMSKLTRRQRMQEEIAGMNLDYLLGLSDLVDHGGVSHILPVNVVKALDGFVAAIEHPSDPTGHNYLAKLRTWQKAFPTAKAELKKRNYEGSVTYKKKWAELVKAGDYNYVVQSEDLWNLHTPYSFERDSSPGMKRRFPKGVLGFFVSTPAGFAPIFIKDHGRFKILFVLPYPYRLIF